MLKIIKSIVKAKQAQKVVNNLVRSDELKELVGALGTVGAVASKVQKRFNKEEVMKHFNLNGKLLRGNDKAVYTHLMEDTLELSCVLPLELMEREDIYLSLDDWDKYDKEELYEVLQSNPELVESVPFELRIFNLTKAYRANMRLKNYLGNRHLELSVECNLVEHDNKQNLLSTQFRLRNTVKDTVVHEFVSMTPLKDVEFKSNSKVAHAHLPVCLNHYLTTQEDNQVVLVFKLA